MRHAICVYLTVVVAASVVWAKPRQGNEPPPDDVQISAESVKPKNPPKPLPDDTQIAARKTKQAVK